MRHRAWTTIRAVTLAALLAASAPPNSQTGKVAPLPDGLIGSGESKVRGVYAASRFGGAEVNDEVARLESTCADRGVAVKVEGRDLPWAGKRQIYRTRDTIAVVEDAPTIVSDKPSCTARISLQRNI